MDSFSFVMEEGSNILSIYGIELDGFQLNGSELGCSEFNRIDLQGIKRVDLL